MIQTDFLPCCLQLSSFHFTGKLQIFTILFKVSTNTYSDHILICALNFLPNTAVFDSSGSCAWGSRIAYGLRSSWMSEHVIPDAGLDCSVISNWLFNIVNSFISLQFMSHFSKFWKHKLCICQQKNNSNELISIPLDPFSCWLMVISKTELYWQTGLC